MSIRPALQGFLFLAITSASTLLASTAAAEPSKVFNAVDRICTLEHFVGLSEEDALAVEEVICSEAQSRKAAGVRYRVRVSRLGRQTVVRLGADKDGAMVADRQLVLSGIDEVPVAAPRLVDAVLADRPVGETRDVDNVVGGEVRPRKAEKARINGYLGVTGAGTLGADPTAGVYFGVSAGNARWTFIGDVRLAGDIFESAITLPLQVAGLGLWKPELTAPTSFGSLGAGMRHHFSASDTSPFVGMGIGLNHAAIRDNGSDIRNTGLAAFGEVGIDILRTSTVGGVVFFRFDAPTYALEGTKPGAQTATSTSGAAALPPPREGMKSWQPFASITFSMRF